MDLFGAPAYYVKRVSGAGSGVQEAAKELGLETLPDFMPETDNWFTRLVNQTSGLKVGHAFVKIALSPRSDKWDVFNEKVKEGWNAGRILYSGIYDESIREEYLRRYRAGEDPELLAMEIENPIAEMVGERIFDPTNILGILTKAKTADRVLDASEIAVKASGTLGDARALEVIDELGKLGKADDVKAAALMDELVSVHINKVDEVKKTKLVQEYGYTKLAAGSNRSVSAREAQNFIGIVQATARSAGRQFAKETG